MIVYKELTIMDLKLYSSTDKALIEIYPALDKGKKAQVTRILGGRGVPNITKAGVHEVECRYCVDGRTYRVLTGKCEKCERTEYIREIELIMYKYFIQGHYTEAEGLFIERVLPIMTHYGMRVEGKNYRVPAGADIYKIMKKTLEMGIVLEMYREHKKGVE